MPLMRWLRKISKEIHLVFCLASVGGLITAIGVSYFLQNGAQLLWTSNIKMFPSFFSASPIELTRCRRTRRR